MKMKKKLTQRFAVLGLWSVVMLSGCGSRPTDAPTAELHPFTGIVLVDNAPAHGAVGTLHPVEDNGLGVVTPSGLADDLGLFAVTTYKPGDGAPAGTYRVTVSWAEVLNPGASEPDYGKSKLPLRYSQPDSSGLEIAIVAGTNDPRTLELKSK